MSYDNDFARNVITFGVNDASYFIFILMKALVNRKKFRTNFTKAKTKFYLSLYYNDANSYLYVNKTDF